MTNWEIDCERALSQVLEYLDHELGEDERKAMAHHLHTCQSCFSRTEFERRFKEQLGLLRDDDEVSPAASRRIKDLLKSF